LLYLETVKNKYHATKLIAYCYW